MRALNSVAASKLFHLPPARHVSASVESCCRLLCEYSDLIYFDRRTAHRTSCVRDRMMRFNWRWNNNKWSSVECDSIKDLLPSHRDGRIFVDSRHQKKKKKREKKGKILFANSDNTHPDNLWLGLRIYWARVIFLFFFFAGWIYRVYVHRRLSTPLPPSLWHRRGWRTAATEKPLKTARPDNWEVFY